MTHKYLLDEAVQPSSLPSLLLCPQATSPGSGLFNAVDAPLDSLLLSHQFGVEPWQRIALLQCFINPLSESLVSAPGRKIPGPAQVPQPMA